MSSSYNIVSSSPSHSFLLFAAATAAPRANNINRDVTLTMPMIQPPNSVSAPPKKRRAGNPHPDAVVIALSPRRIMATNTFVCEACNRGFPREQNLLLHMRVHKLPWELRKKSNEEPKKKVYVCPEPTCLHHDPSRALGDITGMKKHFYRKHCEKNLKCEKCTKRYALQSDLKAHSKICGTKVYGCDCGTIFSRRDKYTAHKTFCDALIQESSLAKNPPESSLAAATAATAESGSMFTFYGDNASNPSPTNIVMQGLSTRSNPIFMNQHDMISLRDSNNNAINDFFNFGYSQDYTKSSHQKSTPSLFTNGVADDNDPTALLRGLTSSSSSSVVVNNIGKFHGLMHTVTATTDNHGRSSGSMYDIHCGEDPSIGGSNRMTFDFLGVIDRGDRNGAPNLEAEMKFTTPNESIWKSLR